MANSTNYVAPLDDDEWEYEYDENETEDFYITVDLSTHVKPSDRTQFTDRRKPKVATSQSRNAKRPRFSGRKKREPEEGSLSADPPVEKPAEGPAIEGGGDNDELENDESQSQQPLNGLDGTQEQEDTTMSTSIPREEKIQILELHSDSPVISIAGKVYKCHWASSVGTDMLFEAPDKRCFAPNPSSNEDATTANAKLIALTRHRLVAKPITLTARTETVLARTNKARAARENHVAFSDPSSETPRRKDARERRDMQASFLNRLSEARRAKGEDPWVPRNRAELRKPEQTRLQQSSTFVPDAAYHDNDDEGPPGDLNAAGGWSKYASASIEQAVLRGNDSEPGPSRRRRPSRASRQKFLEYATSGSHVDIGGGRGFFVLSGTPRKGQPPSAEEITDASAGQQEGPSNPTAEEQMDVDEQTGAGVRRVHFADTRRPADGQDGGNGEDIEMSKTS